MKPTAHASPGDLAATLLSSPGPTFGVGTTLHFAAQAGVRFRSSVGAADPASRRANPGALATTQTAIAAAPQPIQTAQPRFVGACLPLRIKRSTCYKALQGNEQLLSRCHQRLASDRYSLGALECSCRELALRHLDLELEGIVAKRRSGRYEPGERGWVKVKNRAYWRYELEREAAINRPRRAAFAMP